MNMVKKSLMSDGSQMTDGKYKFFMEGEIRYVRDGRRNIAGIT
jgi:hypothetical protein